MIVDFTDQDMGPELLHLMTYDLGKGEGNTVECESFLRAYLINGGASRQRVSAVTGTVIVAAGHKVDPLAGCLQVSSAM